MIIDLNKYRLSLPMLNAMLHDKTEKERYEHISLLALSTHVPVIAVVCFIEELYGNNIQLTTLLTQLCKFYNIDEIVGKQQKDV